MASTSTAGDKATALPDRPAIETDPTGIPIIDTAQLDDHILGALDEASDAVRASPVDGTAWGDLGRFFQAHKYLKAATYAYLEAERLQPSEPRWPHLLGTIASETGNPEAAIVHFDRAAAMATRSLPTFYELGAANLALDHLDEAERNFERVKALAPDAPWGELGLGLVAQRRGKASHAIQKLEQALTVRSDLHQARYALALLYRDEGRTEEAAALLSGIDPHPSPAHPHDPWLDEAMRQQAGIPKLILLGNALVEQGRFEEAEARYRTVLEHDPDSYDGHYNLGVLLGRTSRFEESVEETLAAIAIDPNRAEAHFILAMAYFSLGRYEQADAAIDKSLRLDPDDGRSIRLKQSLHP